MGEKEKRWKNGEIRGKGRKRKRKERKSNHALFTVERSYIQETLLVLLDCKFGRTENQVWSPLCF